MKVIRYHEFGGPEVLRFEEVQMPEAGEGQVLVKVAATTINNGDIVVQAGLLSQLPLPRTPGMECSGVVVTSNLEGYAKGDRVIVYPDKINQSVAAEYIVAGADYIAPAPKNISVQEAAFYPAVGTTAWQAMVALGDVQKDQKVLITAISGAVGLIALQIAKWKGAYVYGTASPAAFDTLKELGADELIDYHVGNTADHISEPLDLVLNMAPLSPKELAELAALVTCK